MPCKLTLARQATGAMELRRGRFDVILDGDRRGTIDRHGEVEFQLESGHHTLQVRTGRYSSPLRSFDAADGTDLHFRCNGAILWPQYLASLVVPGIGLRLHE